MTGAMFVFDSATPEIFLGYALGDRTDVLCEQAGKRSFLSDFPLRLAAFMKGKPIRPETTVYLGIGPGSFTGLKSGAALVGAFLYARGTTKMKCISSLDLLLARTMPDEGMCCFAAVPFHDDSIFATLSRWSYAGMTVLVPPRVVSVPLLGSFTASLSPRPDIIAAATISPTAEQLLHSSFPDAEWRAPGKAFHPSTIEALPVLSRVDICCDPLFLGYMAAPGGLERDDRAYYTIGGLNKGGKPCIRKKSSRDTKRSNNDL